MSSRFKVIQKYPKVKSLLCRFSNTLMLVLDTPMGHTSFPDATDPPPAKVDPISKAGDASVKNIISVKMLSSCVCERGVGKKKCEK